MATHAVSSANVVREGVLLGEQGEKDDGDACREQCKRHVREHVAQIPHARGGGGAARRRRRMRSAHGEGGELGAGYEQHGGGEREDKGDGLQDVTER